MIRDDLLRPLVEGNKSRKLDGMMPELRDSGVTDIVSRHSPAFKLARAAACVLHVAEPWDSTANHSMYVIGVQSGH